MSTNYLGEYSRTPTCLSMINSLVLDASIDESGGSDDNYRKIQGRFVVDWIERVVEWITG